MVRDLRGKGDPKDPSQSGCDFLAWNQRRLDLEYSHQANAFAEFGWASLRGLVLTNGMSRSFGTERDW
jgi:hypothetical protein